ncbi:hypothetical protein H6F93_08455 [Leptolyngbya sp. FACHB-671]|nr:hypothetical protein [Leptolyngbya sp. FACHB-671]MBD2067563.1 hypothetical protein [Leptolyngbya sp. FACHB-671]
MIKYKDFAPQATAWGFLGRPTEVEPFSAVVSAMNQWIEHNPIQVINVETVVLPKYSSQDMNDGLYVAEYSAGSVSWHQCVRIWYRE